MVLLAALDALGGGDGGVAGDTDGRATAGVAAGDEEVAADAGVDGASLADACDECVSELGLLQDSGQQGQELGQCTARRHVTAHRA